MTYAEAQCVERDSLPAATLDHASRLLARAFFQDPLFVHAQPVDYRRQRGLPRLFSAVLGDAARLGGVLSIPNAVLGWMRVDDLRKSLAGDVRRGYGLVPLRFGIKATLRLCAHDDWCNQRMLELSAPDAAYILCVGVEPNLAGRGIGSKLVTEALSRIGVHYRSCTLRTEQPKNVHFYERLGFRCVEQLVHPKSGIPSWFFVRPLPG